MSLFDNAELSTLTGDVRLYLPGWATDYRVFSPLTPGPSPRGRGERTNATGDSLVEDSQNCDSPSAASQKWDPKGDIPLLIKKQTRLEGASVDLYLRISDPADIPYLRDLIATSAAKWHLIGLSLGGFMAHELATALPEKMKKLTMIGIRDSYPASVCRAMQRQLRQNKAALMADFWGKAFGADAAYPSCDIPTDVLSRGLAYLADYSWDDLGATSCPVMCIHGEMDLIAPLSEVQGLASRKGWLLQVLARQAHVPSGW